jgi:phospholipid transport system transporter-binding protein
MQRENDRVTVSGRLTLDTAREVATALFNSNLHPAKGERLVVDLARVEAVDSSAVSVLLQWSRLARAHDVNLAFINLPPNLLSLANLYGVSEMLQLA